MFSIIGAISWQSGALGRQGANGYVLSMFKISEFELPELRFLKKMTFRAGFKTVKNPTCRRPSGSTQEPPNSLLSHSPSHSEPFWAWIPKILIPIGPLPRLGCFKLFSMISTKKPIGTPPNPSFSNPWSLWVGGSASPFQSLKWGLVHGFACAKPFQTESLHIPAMYPRASQNGSNTMSHIPF